MATRQLHAFSRILVPVSDTAGCDQAMTVACGLAAEHGASITILTAVEVPPDLPLDALMPEEEARARALLAEAQAIAELHGVNARTRVMRARGAGEAIVGAASGNAADLVVVGAPRRHRSSPRSRVFGKTVAFVLGNAPCRVMVAAPPPKPR